MGLGGITIWKLAIILGIILLLFGTKKLRTLGSDLGGALKGFREALRDEPKPTVDQQGQQEPRGSRPAGD